MWLSAKLKVLLYLDWGVKIFKQEDELFLRVSFYARIKWFWGFQVTNFWKFFHFSFVFKFQVIIRKVMAKLYKASPSFGTELLSLTLPSKWNLLSKLLRAFMWALYLSLQFEVTFFVLMFKKFESWILTFLLRWNGVCRDVLDLVFEIAKVLTDWRLLLWPSDKVESNVLKWVRSEGLHHWLFIQFSEEIKYFKVVFILFNYSQWGVNMRVLSTIIITRLFGLESMDVL